MDGVSFAIALPFYNAPKKPAKRYIFIHDANY